MKKILLACIAGMSSSLLVKRMEQYIVDNQLDYSVEAMNISEAKKIIAQYDLCLIGPQIRDQLHLMQSLSATPVMVIDKRAYGLIDGKKVVQDIQDFLK